MIIPYDSLETDILERLLEEIVTRDGTDYGSVEKSTSEKINRALRTLQSGKSVLLWDDESESASLVSKEYAQKLNLQGPESESEQEPISDHSLES